MDIGIAGAVRIGDVGLVILEFGLIARIGRLRINKAASIGVVVAKIGVLLKRSLLSLSLGRRNIERLLVIGCCSSVGVGVLIIIIVTVLVG